MGYRILSSISNFRVLSLNKYLSWIEKKNDGIYDNFHRKLGRFAHLGTKKGRVFLERIKGSVCRKVYYQPFWNHYKLIYRTKPNKHFFSKIHLGTILSRRDVYVNTEVAMVAEHFKINRLFFYFRYWITDITLKLALFLALFYKFIITVIVRLLEIFPQHLTIKLSPAKISE